ncbi:MAG: tRNA 5-hydroxyuridine modification protein YegQ [Candidatus Marinimicrobia bacterium]|jgi:putative protease|nr:tRNA 5-hydroxyuridine modification protein YegQ [Candidatus Neomarinimicrobiota bacterium]MBT4034976.1 tRNA 5-hydroxyuridine modification protein YegQ [Candidatus Neomarinimicrobiota bacterium]MBT4361404.1 tRNA 5-hydroxyuridine modification protein YegQ [Candidatus Neomarinimicrobiota bacterium]MBT4713875.1 tRNA 5-hydroxyuridine modification protein YegQ [Candidatus Neomarinimicrobiota bacterium]MBT4994520.1 tRNA 5-hydroxyuridine modification protein YegQ [Candidatus Neomarinimicrobiota bact
MNKTTSELLLPAGNFEKLKYAFAYGADAVYAGVPRYSLRTRENEFRKESLLDGIAYTHDLGKKLYLTMNIYAHNTKIKGFMDEMERMLQYKPDAMIMADPGLIHLARKEFPQLDIHLSTQANCTNWASADFWRDQGVTRIILSRELSLKEIAEIHAKVPDVELEAFVHGAICIAYSGRCLITNYMNNMDANQGTCTNSCRWGYNFGQKSPSLLEMESQDIIQVDAPYTPPEDGFFLEEPKRPGQYFDMKEDEHGTYMMNAKDLCSIELLQQMRDAGIVSYKIEGRTKSVYYAAMTARSYRKAIDDMEADRPFDSKNLEDLIGIAHRGYISGFYTKNPQEYGQNYVDPSSQDFTHQNAGMVTSWDQSAQLLEFEIKNQIRVGETLEIISPDKTVEIVVEELYNGKKRPVDVVHGGTGLGYIPFDHDPGKFTVMRKVLAEARG